MYWYCIELIAHKVDKDDITFSLEHDSRIIARNTGCTPQKVSEMMKYFVNCGLFEISGNVITCLKMAKRLDKSMTSNPEMRSIIAKLKIKSHDLIMTESEIVMQDQIRLDQIRLDKNRLDKEIDHLIELAFDLFWSSGIRKVNKKKSLSIFKSLAKKNCTKDFTVELMAGSMVTDIKQRLANNQLGFAEMHPTTYLNGERWNDEQVQAKHAVNNQQTAAQRTAAAFEERDNQRNGQNQVAMDDRIGTVCNQVDERLGNYPIDNSGKPF